MLRKILPALAAPLAFLVPLISFAGPTAPAIPAIPSSCLATAAGNIPAGTSTGQRKVEFCYYIAGATTGQWEVFTIGSWTIQVTHAGVSAIVARGSLTSPNMFGSFKTAIGDRVDVSINAICPVGSPNCAAVGTVLASDEATPVGPPVFPTVPGLPVAPPSSSASPSPSATPSTGPQPSLSGCQTQAVPEQVKGSGQPLGHCEYTAHSAVGGWVAPTLDGWTITVRHAGAWTTVAKGSMTAPNPTGSFVVNPGDLVRVSITSACLVPGVCGSFGTVAAQDRSAATPSTPPVAGVSNTPKPSPVATPSTQPVPTVPGYCLAQAPFKQLKGADKEAAHCEYYATATSGQWQMFTIGSWTISVKHAGVTTIVAKGSLSNPNAFGSFPTAIGDLVTVQIYSICTAGSVFCGSVGTVLASDHEGALPAMPSFPTLPKLPGVPGSPSQVPSTTPSPTAPGSPGQCVTSPPVATITGADRGVAGCFYIAQSKTGTFAAPTIGTWSITTVRKGHTVELASGSAKGANPQGTYQTAIGEKIIVTINSICTPGNVFCGSLGSVRASDQ